MKSASFIKLLSVTSVLVLLGACGSKQSINYAEVNTTSERPAVIKALEWDALAQDDFSSYQASSGHKAFAMVVSNGRVISTGSAIDKISIEAAEEEALRLCQYANFADSSCFILDRDSSNMNVRLSQAEISIAPKELTSFSDIKNYNEFVNASSPKAFAISPISGQSFWATGGFSLDQVQEYALESCNALRHSSEPDCKILISQ